jgi:NADPH2:quinone reductase
VASVIRIVQTGGPEVMSMEESSEQTPGPGEVWLKQEAVGVNFLDVTQRNGAVPIPLPSGLGYEAAGRVNAVGPGVINVSIGDRVAYATGPIGAYASGRIFPAERLVRLPDDVSYDEAAGVLFKGITAQYLLKSVYPVGPGKVVLLYAASGALGQIMARWAKHLGAAVIGVISSDAREYAARSAGCDAVLVWGASDMIAEVSKFTGGKKVDVVYDSIGRTTFAASLDSLRPRGMLVSFGAASGAPAAVEVGTLNAKGSLFLTRPSIFAYTADSAEYRDRAADVLATLAAGTIKPAVWQTFSLAQAAEAHAALEGRKSHGAIVLKP